MGKADKRARKRENQAKAQQARESAARKQKQRKQFTYAAVALVLVLGIVGAVSLSSKDDKKTATTSTTAAPNDSTPTTTGKLPAGCNAAKPTKQGNGKTYSAAPAMTVDAAKKYTATIETSCGPIVVDLDVQHSPKGVNNFVFLAREGFYDGLSWHRAVSNFVIQGGDPKGDGTGGPGYSVVTEWPTDAYKTGDLAWAKSGAEPAGSAGSQFFVTTGDPAALNSTKNGAQYDYGYFGHVTSGLDNAKKIESLSPGDGAPTVPVYITKVTITES